MLCILNDRTDAAFNLATEEYLLHHCREDCCMLWRNHRAIIVGRNQNPWSQVDAPRVQRHEIPVLRRLTGGGTVFQDTGNINFTFIRCRCGTPSLDFSRFLAPITAFLTTAGLNVRTGEAGALSSGDERYPAMPSSSTGAAHCITAPCCSMSTCRNSARCLPIIRIFTRGPA